MAKNKKKKNDLAAAAEGTKNANTIYVFAAIFLAVASMLFMGLLHKDRFQHKQ